MTTGVRETYLGYSPLIIYAFWALCGRLYSENKESFKIKQIWWYLGRRIIHKAYELESHSWRCVLDATLCDKVCQ
jgi:hypothetical protein